MEAYGFSSARVDIFYILSGMLRTREGCVRERGALGRAAECYRLLTASGISRYIQVSTSVIFD